MDRDGWDARYRTTELLWTAKPNQFLVAEGGPMNLDVLFSPDDVVADLANSGLVIDRADRAHRAVETADGERIAIDALVRAHRPGPR